MSEASAKLCLNNTVTREDARRAIDIIKYYLMQVGYDHETKTFDIDKISGMTTSKRSKAFIVRDLITQLESRLGKLIPIEEIEKELDGKFTKVEIEDAIGELIKHSIIYEPRSGYVQKI